MSCTLCLDSWGRKLWCVLAGLKSTKTKGVLKRKNKRKKSVILHYLFYYWLVYSGKVRFWKRPTCFSWKTYNITIICAQYCIFLYKEWNLTSLLFSSVCLWRLILTSKPCESMPWYTVCFHFGAAETSCKHKTDFISPLKAAVGRNGRACCQSLTRNLWSNGQTR